MENFRSQLDGSWETTSQELPALAELGITCLEIIPWRNSRAGSAGEYDGASTRLYGRPIFAASSTAPMLSGSPSSSTSSTTILAQTETIEQV
jgi:hypothetical protein